MKKDAAEGVKNKVLVNFILDKSGSMESVRDETILGFNSYLRELKADQKTDYRFSLTTFDTNFDLVYVDVPLEQVTELKRDSYAPGGWTALYDAVGMTIKAVERKAGNETKVLVVIMTDGHENSSQGFDMRTIRNLVVTKEKLENWTFVYLGAVADAWDAGGQMGLQVGNIATYDVNKIGGTMLNLAASTKRYAADTRKKVMDFYDGKKEM